ncbi:MAG: SagB/ThcOx family dehydrogenase [Myxococcales bacterium]|nr:SagB/ThcOx family dehydrogenase [Myxococcales bacterium]
MLTDLLQRRRSRRRYDKTPLSLEALARLLWAAQGITHRAPGRRPLHTAPSAGALYPLTFHVVAGHVSKLPAGAYRYDPERHTLQRVARGDQRARLATLAVKQRWIELAPAALVVTGLYARTAAKYGARAKQYVHIEVGHAAQNVCLMATALGLSATPVGAFDEPGLRRLLSLTDAHTPLLLLPVGKPR